MTAPFHLSKTGVHYTPIEVIELTRQLFGQIDLDPASDPIANERVGAVVFFGVDDDCLSRPWHGNVLLNAPGTCKTSDGEFPGCGSSTHGGKRRKTCSCSYVKRFWNKLTKEFREGRVHNAVWVGFNIQQLQTLQSESPHPLQYPFCIPRKRLKYGGDSPPHASYIAFVGDMEYEFAEVFSELGEVIVPPP